MNEVKYNYNFVNVVLKEMEDAVRNLEQAYRKTRLLRTKWAIVYSFSGVEGYLSPKDFFLK